MKKLLLSVSAIALLFTSSCSKKDDNNSTPANSWTIGSNTYTATTITRNSAGGYSISAAAGTTSSNSAGLTFIFPSFPTAGGSYKVTSAFNVGSLASNQIAFISTSIANSSTTSYYSTGNDNVNATITVNSGKIGITLPAAWGKNPLSTTDSVKVSGSISE